MKKLTSMLGLLAVAAGLTAAVAMAPAPEKTSVKSSQLDPLYWFSPTGDPEGLETIANKQEECGLEEVECARGYNTPTPGPSDTPLILEGEQN